MRHQNPVAQTASLLYLRLPTCERLLLANSHQTNQKRTVKVGSFILFTIACLLFPTRSNSQPTTTTQYPQQNLLPCANPFCGTTHDGGLYPGATAPFGMIQWSPDSGKHQTLAGYNYKDSSIYGFSLDHLSGGGSYYAGDFDFMPVLSNGLTSAPANRYAFDTPFSHTNETASAGYYAVTLDNGIKVELTATIRTGFARFTFPAGTNATITINAGSNITGTTNSTVRIDPAARTISGSATGGHFLGHPNICTVYFYAVFNHPFTGYGIWANQKLVNDQTTASAKSSGAYAVFDTADNKTVLARVAISYVSVENAKANLEAENPITKFSSSDFDQAVQDAGQIWNQWLNRIQITGGSVEDRKTFYSMFYHTLLAPTVVSDANGQYLGYDGKVHTTENEHRQQYGFFSGWDVYRSECQFLAMIAPDEASDMAQSLLLDYQQGGAFPRWGLATDDSGVMDGDPSAPIIAGTYAFGATNFDSRAALAGLIRAATDPTVQAPRSKIFERDALADYLKLGYVAEDQHGIWNGYGNVSMTLEYDSSDFAVSQLAQALGDETNATALLKQAQNWKHLYNPETHCLQMRRRDGSWAPGFTNNVLEYDHNRAYQEGTAEQFIWMVPFNLKDLIESIGGPDAASARLDTFFTQLNAGAKSTYAYMGNEPCLETPWIYCFFGQPYKTQQVVRRILHELYSSAPDGYPGNDDLGEMSSWYAFSALGMYPELPGSDILVLNSPLFPKAVLHLKHGDLVIEASGAESGPYVQSLTLNGHQWNQPWLRYSDLSHGATLSYQLSATPNPKWASDPTNAPPSYK